MRRLVFIVLLISACWTGVSSAQTRFTARAGPSSGGTIPSAHTSDGFIPPSLATWSDVPPASVLPVAPALPRMSAELALEAYHQDVTRQATELASYSANILVRVQLPDTSQQGEFELERHYAAPRDLQFKAVRYTGDGFVKSNVITRLLQSEVGSRAKGRSFTHRHQPCELQVFTQGKHRDRGAGGTRLSGETP